MSTEPRAALGWATAGTTVLLLVAGCGHSRDAGYRDRVDGICGTYVRSLPRPQIAASYRLELAGLRTDIAKRDRLIGDLRRIAPPTHERSKMSQYLAELRAIDPLERRGIAAVTRTHRPIVSNSLAMEWDRHIRLAQDAARALNAPNCVRAAKE